MSDPMPAKVPLRLYRGDSRTWEDTFTLDGEPMPLDGYEFLSQIRADPDSSDVMAVIDVEVLDAAAGKIRRTLTAEEARKLTGQRGYWDLQMVRTADQFTRTYMAGPVKIVSDASRA